MKTTQMNTFLMGLAILATATMAHAQQSSGTAPARVATTNSSSSTSITGQAPAASQASSGFGYSSNNGFYSETGKNYKEEDLKSKEVSKEIAMPKGGEIYIENSSRAVVVKTWDQPKVKITTTIYYDGESKLSDDEWLEKSNISLKTLGTSVKIKSGNGGNNFYTYSSNGNTIIANGNVSVWSDNGRVINGNKSSLKKVLTVTIPAGSKIDIESKYSDVTLPAGIGDVNVDLSNGNLEADNINKLTLRSKYSNINVGDIKTAEVEFTNGRFSAKNVDDLDIESKYSTIEMASAKKIVLRSTNDEYELEEAGEVRARKSYGNLRITKLNNSLEVDGQNADVKVRKVGTGLSLIKMDNRYADVRIPLRDTKSYSVDFAGTYSSVYGNFEKQPVPDKAKEGDSQGSAQGAISGTFNRSLPTARGWGDSGSGPSKFTAKVGDGSGLKVDMKCQNCTVDFK